MVYRRFWIQIVVRTLLLSATIALVMYLSFRMEFWAGAVLLGIIAAGQVWSLIVYVNKVNRDLTRLFRSVRYSDFSQTFTAEGRGGSHEELRQAFNDLNRAFRETRAESEENYRYVQSVVQHLAVGLLAFTPDGEVQLINTATRRIFNTLRCPGAARNIDLLRASSAELAGTLRNLRHGERTLLKIEQHGEALQLAMQASEFKLRDRPYKLVSIQNIHGELEEKEMEAWQNLVRVLTHEIMNSITPIASLASTASELLDSAGPGGEDGVEDARLALATIEKRSQGLMHFVDAYRNLTRIPRPEMRHFKVSDLFGEVRKLVSATVSGRPVEVQCTVSPPDLQLYADPQLIEQVLINLLTNALHAVRHAESPRVELDAGVDPMSRVMIRVTDNGGGMAADVQARIFVPFFTTKEGGSGIGLSLSRQIMRLHHGSIAVSSAPGGPTTFTLRF